MQLEKILPVRIWGIGGGRGLWGWDWDGGRGGERGEGSGADSGLIGASNQILWKILPIRK